MLDLLTHTSGLMSGPMGNSVANAPFNKRHDIGLRWIEELGAVAARVPARHALGL